MRRYMQIAAGVAGLLVLGTTGAHEKPASLAPVAAPVAAARVAAMTLAAGPAATITPAIVRRIEREFTDTCVVSENPSYAEEREFWGGGMSPGILVLSRLKYTFGISSVRLKRPP